MPKVRALTPEQAKKTFANRFTKTADKLRQIATNFGLRPYRVFLTWTRWSGVERGEGDELEVRRTEILPTPKLESLDNVTFSFFHAGTLPVGSVKLSRISGATFTYDILAGKVVPVEHEDHIPEPYDFFYEIIEDGRGDPNPLRSKYRLLNTPFRRAGKVDWMVMLERISEDRDRAGKSQITKGTEG